MVIIGGGSAANYPDYTRFINSSLEQSLDNDINFISRWIDAGCPVNDVDSAQSLPTAKPPSSNEGGHSQHLAYLDSINIDLRDVNILGDRNVNKKISVKEAKRFRAFVTQLKVLRKTWVDARADEVVAQLNRIEDVRHFFAADSSALLQQLLDSLDLECLDLDSLNESGPVLADPICSSVIEIGAGTGQLRLWLPESLLNRVVHTEPLDLAISQFRTLWPGAKIRKAKAEQLPFADAEVSLALALCVLDVVDDGERVASELARVLRPGGYVVHLLDLTISLTSIFHLFEAAAVVPLPNVFLDRSSGVWPEDMYLIPRDQLLVIQYILQRHAHPLAAPLASYLAVFVESPFSKLQAVAAYTELRSTQERRDALARLFVDTYPLATIDERAVLVGFSGEPCSSARLLSQVFAQWFSTDRGFTIERSDILTRSRAVKKETLAPYRYESVCIGEIRHLPELPVTQLNPETTIGPDEGLIELGIFCFVARRLENKT